MADDLDENYILDEKFIAKNSNISDDDDDDEEIDDDAVDNDSDDDNNRKRQRISLDQARPTASNKKPSRNEDENKTSKKKKKLNITEILKLKKDELDDPDFAVNEFKKIIVEHMKKNLSSVEKNDLNLTDDTSDKLSRFIVERTKNLSKLKCHEQIIRKLDEELGDYLNKKENSSKLERPFVVVLCSSAVRCIELQKDMEKAYEPMRNKRLKWIYAFAKHKKLNEQIEYIKSRKTPIHMVFATPQRLIQLIQNDTKALKLDCLKYVIIDYNHRDIKQKRLVDIPDIKKDFIGLLFDYFLPLNKEKLNIKFQLT